MKLLFTLSLVLSGMVLLAQRGAIAGSAATSDGRPAEYVNITVKEIKKTVTVDNAGKFYIRNLEPGTYTVLATFTGLPGQEQRVELRPGSTAQLQFVLNIASKELEQVVVTSYRNRYVEKNPSSSLRLTAPLIELPQNIQVVTGDVLKSQQVISMSDGLIRNVSGLTRLEHWGDLYTNITARGSQIQAFRNGFNVVSSYWGPLTEDMSFVESVEFIKGPAGFMLSNGDPSGLYNVVTKKPTGKSKGEVAFTMGSFDLYRTTLDLDGKLSEDGRLLYRFNAAAQNKKSHRPNEFNNRYAIAPVLSYQLDDQTLLTLEYNYQHADMSNVGSYYVFSPDGFKTLPVDFTMLPAGIPGTKIHDHSVYANIQHKINGNWKVTGQLAKFIYNQEGSSAWPSIVNADGTIIRNIGVWDAKSNMTMGQLFVNGDVVTGPVQHRILAGLDMANKDYMADWGQSHDLDTAGAPFDPEQPNLGVPANGYPNFDRTTPLEVRATNAGGLIDQRYSGIYLQDELGFFDNSVRLTLAGRFTNMQQAVYGGAPDKAKKFTPRVGLSVSVNPQFSVYALYDQAFIPQSGVLANGGKVQPITGNNMELGLKKDWFDGRWNTTLSIYRILKNNELTADPNSPPASGLSVELGQKRAQGVEFDLRGVVAKGVHLVANYAFTNAEVSKVTPGVTVVKEGDIVPGYAKHTANLWLTYRISGGALRGLGFSAGTTWLGDRATYWEASPDPNKEIGDFLRVDAGIFWENERVKINANMFNVLDEYLYSGSWYSWLNAYNWQTDPPRNLRLSFAYKF